MRNRSDAELMRLIRDRHRSALEEIYDRYHRLVYSWALKAMKEEQAAKMVVQAVFTRLWTTQCEYNPDKGQYINWILTITRNIAIDHLRQERRNRRCMSGDPDEWRHLPDHPDNDPAEVVDRKLLRERVQQASSRLSPRQRELIQLCYWEGYTLREIAAMKREPIGTVKNRLHQSLKRLRAFMNSQEGDVR